jgi:hypothetical protein
MDVRARDGRPFLTLPAALRPGDVRELCERARDLAEEGDAGILECDVADVGVPDLITVEALARVELTAGRQGSGIRLRGASVELLELLALCGLPIESVLESEGQSEQGEEARGVQEEGDSADPVA